MYSSKFVYLFLCLISEMVSSRDYLLIKCYIITKFNLKFIKYYQNCSIYKFIEMNS